VAGRAQGSISVTADNVCDGSGTLQLDYTQQVLEYRIDVNYLTYSLFDLTSTVAVSPCGGGGRRRRRDVNDVVISVTISGDYQSVTLHFSYLLIGLGRPVHAGALRDEGCPLLAITMATDLASSQPTAIACRPSRSVQSCYVISGLPLLLFPPSAVH